MLSFNNSPTNPTNPARPNSSLPSTYGDNQFNLQPTPTTNSNMALNVNPTHSVFDIKGGQNKHTIINNTDVRHAFKVGVLSAFVFQSKLTTRL